MPGERRCPSYGLVSFPRGGSIYGFTTREQAIYVVGVICRSGGVVVVAAAAAAAAAAASLSRPRVPEVRRLRPPAVCRPRAPPV